MITAPNDPSGPTSGRPRHVAQRARNIAAGIAAATFLGLGGVMALVAHGTPATATTNPTTGAGSSATPPSSQLVDPFAPLDNRDDFGQWGAQPGTQDPGFSTGGQSFGSDGGSSAGSSHTTTHGS
jgi:hypothetical protein